MCALKISASYLNNAGCTSGFPTPERLRNIAAKGLGMIRNQAYFQVRLIPDMKFTCNGTITRIIVLGEKRPNGNERTKLIVWRENETGFFYKSDQEISLSPDICSKFENYDKAFNCQLPVEMRVSVEPGDFLGIQQPRKNASNFELYSVPQPRLTNYIFTRLNLLPHTIDLCTYSGPNITMQPLIRIRVEPDPGSILCDRIIIIITY